MTGDNGLRDAVAEAIAFADGGAIPTSAPEWYAEADAVLALPAIREALAAVAQRDALLADVRALDGHFTNNVTPTASRTWDRGYRQAQADALCALRAVLARNAPTSPEEPT